MFLDEFGCYFGGQDDQLTEDLRKIDGVASFHALVRSRTTRLVAECVRNAYSPACHRLLRDHTYQTISSFWLTSRAVLRIYPKPKPLP